MQNTTPSRAQRLRAELWRLFKLAVLALVIGGAAGMVLGFIVGCSELPTMKHCDKISYVREGTDINVHAHCTAGASF